MWLIPVSWIYASFIISGNAHFWLGYYYMFRSKNTKIVPTLIVGGMTAAIIGLFFFFGGTHQWYRWIIGTLFSLHVIYDEFSLRGEQVTSTIRTAAVAVFASLVFFLSTTAEINDLYPMWFIAWVPLLAIFFLALFVVFVRSGIKEYGVQYALLLSCLVYLLSFSPQAPIAILGFIVNMHVLNWFFAYGRRVHNTDREIPYMVHIGIASALAIAGFALYSTTLWFPLALFFTPTFYYGFAIIHVAMTLRLPFLRAS